MYKTFVDDTNLTTTKEFVHLKGKLHDMMPSSEVYAILTELLSTYLKTNYSDLGYVEKPWVPKLETILGVLKTLVVEKRRSVGFTTYALRKLYNDAVLAPGTTVAYVAPNSNMKKYFIDLLSKFIDQQGTVKIKYKTNTKIYLDNDSQILVTTPESTDCFDKLMVYKFQTVIIDEIRGHDIIYKIDRLTRNLKPDGHLVISYSDDSSNEETELIKAINNSTLSLIRIPGLV
jgi:hypothetical protein